MGSRYGKRALARLDGRSYSGRRSKELTRVFSDALGGAQKLSEVDLLRVQDAAELQAAAEHARGQYLRGLVPDEVRVVRLTNAANRARRELKLDKVQGKPPASLQDYLKSRQSGAGAPSSVPALQCVQAEQVHGRSNAEEGSANAG